MKKLLFTLFVAAFVMSANAQTSFDKDLKASIEKIETAKTSNDFSILFDEFSNLTKTSSEEKWKAYYYAALVKFKETETLLPEKNYADLSDKNWLAYKYVTTCESFKKDNSEIQKLLGQINDQRKKIDQLK